MQIRNVIHISMPEETEINNEDVPDWKGASASNSKHLERIPWIKSKQYGWRPW